MLNRVLATASFESNHAATEHNQQQAADFALAQIDPAWFGAGSQRVDGQWIFRPETLIDAMKSGPDGSIHSGR